MDVARNDPCPCRSGRKYKDCCLAAEESRVPVLVSTSTRESSLSKLIAFAFAPAFDGDHSIAETVFWGDLLDDAARPEVQSLLDSEDAAIKYNSWFLFDWEVEDEGTVADLFLEEDGVDLTTAERQFLSRLTRAHLRLYEVERVECGYGVWVRDLWTGDSTFVTERTASTRIVTWDLLGARVAPDGAGGHVFEGGLYLYPAAMKSQIVARFRRLHRRYQRKHPRDDSSGFFRRHGMVFNHIWLELVAFPPPPSVLTSDGDPLIFCRVVFDARDPERLRHVLVSRGEIRSLPEGAFAWCEAGDDGTRELGRWQFENDRVILETTSQPRAERGKAWLEALAPDLVRFRATALEPVEKLLDDLRHRQHAGPVYAVPPHALLDVDEASDAVQELFTRHYRAWLDRPHPELGGRTPRTAAGTRLWRRRLIELLKQVENATERAALHGRPPYSVAWVWHELGLDGLRRTS